MNANPLLGRLLAKYHHILKDIIAISSNDGIITVHLDSVIFREHFQVFDERPFSDYYSHKISCQDGNIEFMALESRPI